MCEKLLSEEFVTMFFYGKKFPTPVLCRIPKETFIPSLVPIDQEVSEEKNFEKLLMDNEGRQVMVKRRIFKIRPINKTRSPKEPESIIYNIA